MPNINISTFMRTLKKSVDMFA